MDSMDRIHGPDLRAESGRGDGPDHEPVHGSGDSEGRGRLAEPLRLVFDFFYPPLCALCAVRLVGGERVVCAECLPGLRPVFDWRCGRCGGTGFGPAPAVGRPCAHCPPETAHFEGTLFAANYAEATRRCVHLFKYERRAEAGRLIAALCVERLTEPILALGDAIDVVAPVPLHWFRRRFVRGFNQSETIAAALARATGKPFARALRRTRHTRPQALVPREARATNVRGAFAARAGTFAAGAGVLLVDDVVTTAHTIDECARALRSAGAARVWAAAFAKA